MILISRRSEAKVGPNFLLKIVGAKSSIVFDFLKLLTFTFLYYRKQPQGQIFGAGGAIIQKKNKEKEKGKGKEERREKRKKERGEFNLEDPMFLFNFHSFLKNYKIKILNSLKDWLERENGAGGTRWRPPSQSAFVHDGQISTAPHLIHYHS